MSFMIGEAFFGVLTAFILERLYSSYKDGQNRQKLKENLKGELERCMTLLTGKGNLLPTAMWNSTVTSGDVKLLSFDKRTKISSIYFEIDNHNYEAKRVRDSAVLAGGETGSGVMYTGSQQYWLQLSKVLRENEVILKQKISELLKEPWWME